MSRIRIRKRMIKIETGRICQVCGEPVYKKYLKRFRDGEELDIVCIWEQYFTCSESCRARRGRFQFTEANGVKTL